MPIARGSLIVSLRVAMSSVAGNAGEQRAIGKVLLLRRGINTLHGVSLFRVGIPWRDF